MVFIVIVRLNSGMAQAGNASVRRLDSISIQCTEYMVVAVLMLHEFRQGLSFNHHLPAVEVHQQHPRGL
jgi:hypothetical protein